MKLNLIYVSLITADVFACSVRDAKIAFYLPQVIYNSYYENGAQTMFTYEVQNIWFLSLFVLSKQENLVLLNLYIF
jgi:hypothetical protein